MRRIKETHLCRLTAQSRSMLPKLHPNASYYRRLKRKIRKLALVSHRNPKTIYIYRSKESICMERKRQIKYFSKYVIHPYSIIGMYREIIMSITWLLAFSLDSFKIAFWEVNTTSLFLDSFKYTVTGIYIIHILICFHIGYHDRKKQEIILDHKMIVMKYLKTYLFVDLLLLIPANVFFRHNLTVWLGHTADMLVCARFMSMTLFFRQVTLLFDIGDIIHELLCMIIGVLFLIHWWGVLLYSYAHMKINFFGENWENVTFYSWTDDAQISKVYKNVTIGTRYLKTIHKSASLFLGCSRGMWYSEDPGEWLIGSLVILTGIFYFGYITAMVLQLSLSFKMSESMYDKMLYQLMQYMIAKRLPERLRIRLKLYYSNRFKEKFFRETTILTTLSEHLRYEIVYNNCRAFMESTWFFEGLPRSIVGHVIASLTSTLLITNEVVYCNVELDEEHLYFIASGSMALYTESGHELLHIEDGDYFGEFSLLSDITDYQASEVSRGIRYVAAEITELFILSKEDFMKYISCHPSAVERLLQIAEIRDTLNLNLLRKTHELGMNEIVLHLRNTDFLSRNLSRNLGKRRRYGRTRIF